MLQYNELSPRSVGTDNYYVIHLYIYTFMYTAFSSVARGIPFQAIRIDCWFITPFVSEQAQTKMQICSWALHSFALLTCLL